MEITMKKTMSRITKRTKKITSLFMAINLLFFLLLLFTACGSSTDSVKTSKELSSFGSPKEESSKWLSEAGLDQEESADQLYEKALAEGTLMIYSNSSRIMDVKESFEKEYPGLTVYVEDIRSVDLLEMVQNDSYDGEVKCDLIFCDDNGAMSQELVPNGLIYKYVPPDIAPSILPECNSELLSVVVELQQAFYNSEVYDVPPFNNWWELTEKRFHNRVVMSSPLKSISTMGFFSMILKNNELMEQAYYNRYGKPLEPKNGETAGEAFWRMMFENGLQLVNSSDEVAELVGTPGQDDPPVGIMISSKLRMKELGYALEASFSTEPFCGVYSSNCIMLACGSKNVNSAKLFIRWILGEDDGQGQGYKPYLQNGAWSARSDVRSESKKQLHEITWLPLDIRYTYENRKAIEELISQHILDAL